MTLWRSNFKSNSSINEGNYVPYPQRALIQACPFQPKIILFLNFLTLKRDTPDLNRKMKRNWLPKKGRKDYGHRLCKHR